MATPHGAAVGTAVPGDCITIGVEEEFLLVDPVSRHLTPSAELILRTGDWNGRAEAEMHCSVVETRTDVCTTLAGLRDQLISLREQLGDATVEAGLRPVAAGTTPLFDVGLQRITPQDRLKRMADDYQIVAREQLICGCHTHVGIHDDELKIQVMNRARIWLPVLLALSASSPYWDGQDTGYESYRYEQWRRWPTTGAPRHFESFAAYRGVVDALVGSSAIADAGMLYWDLRPSQRHGTLEFRIADACPAVDDVVLQAGLARAIVRTCRREVQEDRPPSNVPWELVTVASWRAARFGLTGTLIDVRGRRTVPAADHVYQLLDYVRDALDEEGDGDEVVHLVESVLRRGTSSQRQRQAYTRRARLEDVVDQLIAETAGDLPMGASGEVAG